MFILVFMLRHSMTKVRQLGLVGLDILDRHIYFHKISGRLILVYSLLHTAMHLGNLCKILKISPLFCDIFNIPFLWLWIGSWQEKQNWRKLYLSLGPIYWLDVVSNICYFLLSVNNVIYHPDEFVDANSIPRTYSSLANQSFTWKDWVLTTRPGYFGLIRGTAYPTGVAILVILLIMYICSMKWVRKGGYFEVLCVKESPKTALYLCQNSVATVGSFDAWKSKHSVT